MTPLEAARAALAAHEAELARLNAITFTFVGAVRREEEAHADRARRSEWERERDLGGGLRAAATWPEAAHAGVKRWFIGAGTEGRLLVVWEVQEYRGRYASIVHGSCPQSVELDVFRVFELKRPGR